MDDANGQLMLGPVCGVGINTTSWTAASSLLALGLSVREAMGVIVGAGLVIAVLAVGAGWMGSRQFVGFTVLSRG